MLLQLNKRYIMTTSTNIASTSSDELVGVPVNEKEMQVFLKLLDTTISRRVGLSNVDSDIVINAFKGTAAFYVEENPDREKWITFDEYCKEYDLKELGVKGYIKGLININLKTMVSNSEIKPELTSQLVYKYPFRMIDECWERFFTAAMVEKVGRLELQTKRKTRRKKKSK